MKCYRNFFLYLKYEKDNSSIIITGNIYGSIDEISNKKQWTDKEYTYVKE